MHDKIGIGFLVATVLNVVVDSVGIERQCGKSKKQYRIGDNAALPDCVLRRRHTPRLPGGSGCVTKHEIANLDDGVLVVLGNAVFRGDKTEISGAPPLPLDAGDGDCLACRPAKNQIALERE